MGGATNEVAAKTKGKQKSSRGREEAKEQETTIEVAAKTKGKSKSSRGREEAKEMVKKTEDEHRGPKMAETEGPQESGGGVGMSQETMRAFDAFQGSVRP